MSERGWFNTDDSGVRGNGIPCAVCSAFPFLSPYLPAISAKWCVSMSVALDASETAHDARPVESGNEPASETDDAEEPGC